MNNKISIFGVGFIGTHFYNIYKDECITINSDEYTPLSNNILYTRSTTHNYNHPQLDIDINLTKLVKVLDQLKPGDTFNYISSWFIYAGCPMPAKEEYFGNPKGYYSITKQAAERIVETYCKLNKINYRILRLCNVYGNEDKNVSAKKNALQFLLNKVKKNEDIQLYHNGDFIRDYMHVYDVCMAIKLCIDKGELNTIINIGGGRPLHFGTIIETAIKLIGSRSKITSMEPTDFHKLVQVKDMWLDTTKLRSYGFEQKINIEDGLELLLQ